MTRNDSNGPGAFVVGFLAGAAVGAVLALLLAPAPGEETRQYLGRRAREGRDRAAEAARQGREAFQRQREHLTTAFSRAREEYRSGSSGSPEGEGA